jgi:hypothetical protein
VWVGLHDGSFRKLQLTTNEIDHSHEIIHILEPSSLAFYQSDDRVYDATHSKQRKAAKISIKGVLNEKTHITFCTEY